VNIRPDSFDFPLFVHVLGAMALFGAVLTAFVVAVAAWGRPEAVVLRRAVLLSLLVVAVPAYVAMRGGAQWIYSKEGFSGHNDPTWIGVGFGIADGGLLLLLVMIGLAFWWRRSGSRILGRVVTGLAGVYLVLLGVAWLAMSGKWG
jgi:hypothetical protein